MRYHRLYVLSVIATATLSGPATPLAPPWDDMRVKHAWNAVPSDWESLGPPPPGTTIDLHVALKPHNENALIDALYEVSSPGHPKYGAHLSKEEVARLVAPHPETLELVHSWLGHHAIPPSSISTTHGGSWLTLTGVPVSQANKLLGASYQLYRYSGTNDSTILRMVGYSLPTVLHAHVQTVVPTTYFASMRTFQTSLRSSVEEAVALEKVGSRESVTVMSSRDIPMVTPEILRWLYGTIDYEPAATGQNVLGNAGYSNNNPSPTDLTTFMRVFRTDAEDAAFTVEQVNGGEYNSRHPSLWENLIMQYAQAMAYPTPLIHYSIGGRGHWTPPNNEPALFDVMLAWLNYVLAQDKIPQTISTSYGHDEMKVPLEYARALCNIFAQLGLRGVSVLFATGSDGVGAGDCRIDDSDGSRGVQFKPSFPASCPWVTSVGGTTSQRPEVAASLSGGGFSNYFPRPGYQNIAVPRFLRRSGGYHNGLYNVAGRGIPDISAQALHFKAVTNTKVYTVRGTGCSAAIAAGIISLLNDFLLSNNKPPLGFLNPWLYSDGLDGLNDIISGSNPGCGTSGFPAIVGWDPVTGLGTPDFDDLQDVLFDVIPPTLPTPTPRV